MKLLLFSDNHFCENSSIVRDKGTKYSKRLENQLETLNWLEKLSNEHSCDGVVCLGDFFDKPTLNDQELTALKDIRWNDNIPHYFIVGNHESSINGLSYNSTKALESSCRMIVDKPTMLENVLLLPYIIESDRKPLKNYFINGNPDVVLSHNDLKGIQMGPVVSTQGFELSDIKSSCKLFLNGHLHNRGVFDKTIINVGNITGINFSEDAFRYSHCAYILDTETLELTEIENPHALNFYKIEINSNLDLNILTKIKNNAVVGIRCEESITQQLNQELQKISSKLVATRVTTFSNTSNVNLSSIESSVSSVDHIQKFIDFCRRNIDASVILDDELSLICA